MFWDLKVFWTLYNDIWDFISLQIFKIDILIFNSWGLPTYAFADLIFDVEKMLLICSRGATVSYRTHLWDIYII